VNTINGVSGGTGGGSGGTTKTGGPNISYRDYLTKKIQINTSYNYNLTGMLTPLPQRWAV
jgi:hypothetical protein